MVHQKTILEMSSEELRAVTAIVLPGRNGDELKIGEMQEMCIKWLFSNGLSINHIFEIHEDPDNGRGLFCVMRNSEACSCCPKASSKPATLSDFDVGPIGDNFKRTPSPQPKVKFDLPAEPSRPTFPAKKVAPITVQPTVFTIFDDKTEKEKEEEEKSKKTCAYCRRECGLCIVALCSQF